MSDSSGRLVWLDAVRGVGILLVVVGHMAVPYFLSTLIFACHMPLFYLVSGYLFASKGTWATRTYNKFNGLIVPYLLFSAAALLWLLGTGVSGVGDVFLKTLSGTYPVLDATWFLVSLFTVSVFADGATKRVWSTGLAIFVGIVMITFRLDAETLPFRVNLIPMGFLFFYTGMVCRRFAVVDRIACFRRGSWLTLVSVLAVVFGMCCWINGRADMNIAAWGRFWPFFWTTGVAGTMIVFLFFRRAEKLQALIVPAAYLGRRSLYILALHVPVAAGMHMLAGKDWPFRLDRICSVLVLLATTELLFRVVDLFRRRFDGVNGKTVGSVLSSN